MSGAEFLSWAVDASFVMVLLSIGLGLVRIAIGPTQADRVVALDMMTVSVVAFCGLYAIFADDPVFIDVAIVVALIGFLATAALARFAERTRLRETRQDKAEETR